MPNSLGLSLRRRGSGVQPDLLEMLFQRLVLLAAVDFRSSCAVFRASQCVLFLRRILNLDDVRASCRMGRIERMRFAATDRRK